MLVAGELLVVMTDLTPGRADLGQPAFVPSDDAMLHNQRLGLVTVKPGVDLDPTIPLLPAAVRQVAQPASSDRDRHDREAYSSGADLSSVRCVPPRSHTATRSARSSDAIDDLIENNRRRVEVLEEMAQAIYREWFVHFRYPGHENAAFVDSPLGPIPEGWESAPLDAQLVDPRSGQLRPSRCRRDQASGLASISVASGVQRPSTGNSRWPSVDGDGLSTGRRRDRRACVDRTVSG